MPELTPLERLQPSLLDRLTDFDPNALTEGRDQRVMPLRRLKESVLRDLGWLLNSTNASGQMSADELPEVVRSTLNFGIPDLAGVTSSAINADSLAQSVKEAVLVFEPRILKDTLHVTLNVNATEMNHNTLSMQIEGELWAVPVPLHLLVNASLDLETGTFTVVDQGSR